MDLQPLHDYLHMINSFPVLNLTRLSLRCLNVTSVICGMICRNNCNTNAWSESDCWVGNDSPDNNSGEDTCFLCNSGAMLIATSESTQILRPRKGCSGGSSQLDLDNTGSRQTLTLNQFIFESTTVTCDNHRILASAASSFDSSSSLEDQSGSGELCDIRGSNSVALDISGSVTLGSPSGSDPSSLRDWSSVDVSGTLTFDNNFVDVPGAPLAIASGGVLTSTADVLQTGSASNTNAGSVGISNNWDGGSWSSSGSFDLTGGTATMDVTITGGTATIGTTVVGDVTVTGGDVDFSGGSVSGTVTLSGGTADFGGTSFSNPVLVQSGASLDLTTGQTVQLTQSGGDTVLSTGSSNLGSSSFTGGTLDVQSTLTGGFTANGLDIIGPGDYGGAISLTSTDIRTGESTTTDTSFVSGEVDFNGGSNRIYVYVAANAQYSDVSFDDVRLDGNVEIVIDFDLPGGDETNRDGDTYSFVTWSGSRAGGSAFTYSLVDSAALSACTIVFNENDSGAATFQINCIDYCSDIATACAPFAPECKQPGAGTTCSQDGSGVTGCGGTWDDDLSANGDACTGGFCAAGTCEECFNNGNCPGSEQCRTSDYTCVECVDNTPCSATNEQCRTSDNTCVDCIDNDGCPSGDECRTSDYTCVDCTTNGGCSGGDQCRTADNTCVDCINDNGCPGDNQCIVASNTCVDCIDNDGCSDETVDVFCQVSSNTCVECLNPSHCTAIPNNDCYQDGQCNVGTGSGVCIYPKVPDGDPCRSTPNRYCKESDATCVICTTNSHCDDAGNCEVNAGATCNTGSNTCSYNAASEGTVCDLAGNPGVDDGHCRGGGSKACDECTIDSHCDDNNWCTGYGAPPVGESCSGSGTCVAGQAQCQAAGQICDRDQPVGDCVDDPCLFPVAIVCATDDPPNQDLCEDAATINPVCEGLSELEYQCLYDDSPDGSICGSGPGDGDGQCLSGTCVDCFDDLGCLEGLQCNTTTNVCVECGSDVDCNDGQACNGIETCVAQTCVEGERPCPASQNCAEADGEALCTDPPPFPWKEIGFAAGGLAGVVIIGAGSVAMYRRGTWGSIGSGIAKGAKATGNGLLKGAKAAGTGVAVVGKAAGGAAVAGAKVAGGAAVAAGGAAVAGAKAAGGAVAGAVAGGDEKQEVLGDELMPGAKFRPGRKTGGAVPAAGTKEETAEFVKLVTGSKNFQIALAETAHNPKDQEQMAMNLVRVADFNGGGLEFVRNIVEEHVRTTEERELFRATSFAAHVLSAYAALVGGDYLNKVVGKPLRENILATNKGRRQTANSRKSKMLDLDPSRMSTFSSLEAATQELLTSCETVILSILENPQALPGKIRAISAVVRKIVERNFDNVTAKKSVAQFLMLRFISPAIAMPHKHGLTSEPPGENTQRSLILLTKIIQGLTNDAKLGGKEEYMAAAEEFRVAFRPVLQKFLGDNSLANADTKVEKTPVSKGEASDATNWLLKTAKSHTGRVRTILRKKKDPNTLASWGEIDKDGHDGAAPALSFKKDAKERKKSTSAPGSKRPRSQSPRRSKPVDKPMAGTRKSSPSKGGPRKGSVGAPGARKGRPNSQSPHRSKPSEKPMPGTRKGSTSAPRKGSTSAPRKGSTAAPGGRKPSVGKPGGRKQSVASNKSKGKSGPGGVVRAPSQSRPKADKERKPSVGGPKKAGDKKRSNSVASAKARAQTPTRTVGFRS